MGRPRDVCFAQAAADFQTGLLGANPVDIGENLAAQRGDMDARSQLDDFPVGTPQCQLGQQLRVGARQKKSGFTFHGGVRGFVSSMQTSYLPDMTVA